MDLTQRIALFNDIRDAYDSSPPRKGYRIWAPEPNPLEPFVKYLSELKQLLGKLALDEVQNICDVLYQAYTEERAVYVFGNGGSAALASHMACDLGKGTHSPNSANADIHAIKRFKVLSVTDNVPMITAWANDSGDENVFAEQIRNFIQPGDIAFAISSSGYSPKIVQALKTARERQAVTIGLTGFGGGKMLPLLDHALVTPSESMQQVEDVHVIAMHLIFLNFRERFLRLAQVSPDPATATGVGA